MKKAHMAAMHQSVESMKRSHGGDMAVGHGVSEAEGAPMGHGQFANMPQGVHMSIYPKAPAQRGNVLDDTMSGIDKCNHHAESQESRYLSNQH
jgi:hypothetical protein